MGWLFKTKTKTRKKTNLMILLTPHIVKDAADLAEVSDDPAGKHSVKRPKRSSRSMYRKRFPLNECRAMSAPEELEALALKLGIAWRTEIGVDEVDAGLLQRVPLTFARANLILPLSEQEGVITVAITNGAGLLLLDELRLLFGKPIEAVLVPAPP